MTRGRKALLRTWQRVCVRLLHVQARTAHSHLLLTRRASNALGTATH
jgi:hypothetical protein